MTQKNTQKRQSSQSWVRQLLLLASVFLVVTLWDNLIAELHPAILTAWILALIITHISIKSIISTITKKAISLHTKPEEAPIANINSKELISTLKWLKKYREELEQKTEDLKTAPNKTTTKESALFENTQQCAVVVTTDVYNPKSYIIPTQDNTTLYQLLSEQESIIKVTDFLKEKGFETKVLRSESGVRIPASPLTQMNAKSQHPIQFPTNIFTLN